MQVFTNRMFGFYNMTHFRNEKVQIYNSGSGEDVAGQMNDRFEHDILRLKPMRLFNLWNE